MHDERNATHLHWLPLLAVLKQYPSACIGYALFSSSRQVIAGPDAAIGLLAGSVILPLAAGDAGRVALLAAELALLSGALLLLAAQLRLGNVADLLSRPVLVGYLNGASLLLLATQLGKLFGITTVGDAFIPHIQSLLSQIHAVHAPTMMLGLGLITLLWGLARWLPKVPGALVACTVAVVLTEVLDLQRYGIDVVASPRQITVSISQAPPSTPSPCHEARCTSSRK